METERITMSQRERDRLKVLHEVKRKHLSQAAFFDQNGYWPTKFAPRKVSVQGKGTGAETEYSPFLGSMRLDAKSIRTYHYGVCGMTAGDILAENHSSDFA